MANEPEDILSDDEKYFLELLDKRGAAWLTKHLETLKADLAKTIPVSSSQPAGDFAAFWKENFQEAKTENKTLREKLESLLEILTPEQRTLLKSAPKENAGDPPDPAKPPAPKLEPEPAKKKPGFLSRL
jgi:hypothetical protein